MLIGKKPCWETWIATCQSVMSEKGSCREAISHSTTPNDHTSAGSAYRPHCSTSGATQRVVPHVVIVPDADAAPSAPLWTITTGAEHCELSADGRCVSDGSGNYGNNQFCRFEATVALQATTTFFSTERYYDQITVLGQQYSGTSGFTDLALAAGDGIEFRSDYSVTAGGFEICGSLQEQPLWSVTAGAEFCTYRYNNRCISDGYGNYG